MEEAENETRRIAVVWLRLAEVASSTRVFQQLSANCSCAVCRAGCLCGDCEACSNADLNGAIVRNTKRVTALALTFVVLWSFLFFVPVASLGSTPSIKESISFRVQSPQTTTATLGSISFCLFGEGAVLAQGTYYLTVTANQTAKHQCVQK